MYGPQQKVEVTLGVPPKPGTAKLFVTTSFSVVQKPAALIALSPAQSPPPPVTLSIAIGVEVVSAQSPSCDDLKGLLQQAFQNKQLVVGDKPPRMVALDLLNFLVNFFGDSDINVQVANAAGDGAATMYEKPRK
jgi:hypothetical protein